MTAQLALRLDAPDPRAYVRVLDAVESLDRARVIEHASEDALDAACVAAGYASPPQTCTLCDASERGACVAHRRHGTDCARCGTRHYGQPPTACVFCGATFGVPTKEKR